MDAQPISSDFPLYTSDNGNLNADSVRRVGTVSLSANRQYYVIKFGMFPFRYYMRKRSQSQDEYTIFANRVFKGDQARFNTVIGQAKLREDLSGHMEFHFPLFHKSIFMSLFPA